MVERICGTCKLFNPAKGECSVVILHEGEKLNIPVDAEDPCFFEQKVINPETGLEEDFNEIQEVKMWVENPQGKKGKKGTVKIEYPEGFFGIGMKKLESR